MKIPSFTSRSSGSAPTVTMIGSQVSVTDSNKLIAKGLPTEDVNGLLLKLYK